MSEFKFTVYSNKWATDVSYLLSFTETGWEVSANAINGSCEPDGMPLLFANLKNEEIHYPHSLGRFLRHVWEKAKLGSINEDEVQKRINELAEWVITCNKSCPKWPEWNV